MIKGNFEYRNRSVKYSVAIRQRRNTYAVVAESKLGGCMILPLEIILDSLNDANTKLLTDINYTTDDYNKELVKFLDKWEVPIWTIKQMAEDIMKKEIDKEIHKADIESVMSVRMERFNSRERI